MRYRRSWRSSIPAASTLATLLLGCGGTTTRLAPLPPGAVQPEQEKQRELAIQENERQQARLDSLAYPILAHSLSLCPSAQAPVLGLRVATIGNYDKEFQPAAALTLGLTDTLSVIGVVSGAPAALAGLLPGDRIYGMGSRLIPAGREAMKTFVDALAEFVEPMPGKLSILYSRGGEERTTVLSLTPACAYGTLVVNSGELNAFADGERIYVTSGMMHFASDEELRVVIAHEFAHDALERVTARIADTFLATRGINTGGYYTAQYDTLGAEAFSQETEEEADYVGLYALALSDIPAGIAPRFWRHLTQADPKSSYLAHTHPITAERFVRMEQAIREIEQKRADQVALLPELRAIRVPQPAEGSETLLAVSGALTPGQPIAPKVPAMVGAFRVVGRFSSGLGISRTGGLRTHALGTRHRLVRRPSGRPGPLSLAICERTRCPTERRPDPRCSADRRSMT